MFIQSVMYRTIKEQRRLRYSEVFGLLVFLINKTQLSFTVKKYKVKCQNDV